MPIYIYRCQNCGVQFERHQSFSDEPLKRCPECSKNSLRKVLTPAGIVFKGSGWYATDHKSASGAPRQLKSDNKDTSTVKSESTSTGSTSSTSESASSSSSSETSSSSSATKSESTAKTSD